MQSSRSCLSVLVVKQTNVPIGFRFVLDTQSIEQFSIEFRKLAVALVLHCYHFSANFFPRLVLSSD